MTPGNARSRSRADPTEEIGLRASLLDALGEAVVATDRIGRVIYWNAAAEALYGWTAEEAVGSDVATLVAAEGSRADAFSMLRHVRAPNGWEGEFFVKHRDGHSFPIHATASAVRDGEGRVVGMVGVARDLTAQREAEEALRQTEERLELVHRATSSVIWEWDVGSPALRLNDAAADVFGYPPEEVEGTVAWWKARLHPEDRERVRAAISQALEEGRRFWTEEYRFRRGDGTYATIFDRAYVAVDGRGRPCRVVGTMLDLTERRRSHAAARFLEQAGLLLDLSLDYGTTLPSLARLATQTVADVCLLLVGTPHEIEHVVAVAADPGRQEPLDRLTTRLSVTGPRRTLSERVLQDGETIFLPDFSLELVEGALDDAELLDAAGDVGLSGLVLAPMTARGQTVGAVLLGGTAGGERLRDDDVRVAGELGRRIGLAVENARLFHSAELARRAKTDFLSIVSHELRTPLTAVMGYADLLTAQIAGALNETQRHQVERIRAGADKLLQVIEGILAYARLETGRERAQLTRVPLERLLTRVRGAVAPAAVERGIDYEEDLAAAPETVCIDLDKCANVLLALLTNAVKFSGEGGRCGLRVAAESDTLVFEVSDSGPGVSVSHLPHLFSPFWQAEEPEVRRSGGSGLGLSVARRLARVMGGDVSLLATSDQGTTFRVTLPLREG